MNLVRDALHDRLAGDAALNVMLSAPGAIYHRRAPVTAATPLVVFDKNSGTPSYMLSAADGLDRQVWLVKGIDRSGSASVAEDIAARTRALLHNHPLVVSGRPVAEVRRVSDVDYGESDGAELYQHVGGLYLVVTQPGQ